MNRGGGREEGEPFDLSRRCPLDKESDAKFLRFYWVQCVTKRLNQLY